LWHRYASERNAFDRTALRRNFNEGFRACLERGKARGFQQDSTAAGAKAAWFKDTEGNITALIQNL
jgi:hypothetical protein